ncbi:MAG: CapA family protein [Candidatus Paceibacterota bacterium]
MKNFKIWLIFVILLVFVFVLFFTFKNTEKFSFEDLEIPLVRENKVSILAFGDTMFDRGVRNIIENRGRDPFEYIKKDLSLFSDYDIIKVNLEGPIIEIDRSLCQQKLYNFQFASTTPNILKSIGVNMVSIANNHSYDCLLEGFESTKNYLSQPQIDFVGGRTLEDSFIVKNINNKKVAFVGIDETTAPVSVSSFYPLVSRLDTENDFVVVFIHWGKEYELVEDISQKNIAYKLIDNGADLIIGHHPHVIQPLEIYKNKAVFYSLGNFVFDQNFGDTTKGLGVGAVLGESKDVFTLYPLNLKIFAPDLMKDTEREEFCKNFLKNIKSTDCTFEILK